MKTKLQKLTCHIEYLGSVSRFAAALLRLFLLLQQHLDHLVVAVGVDRAEHGRETGQVLARGLAHQLQVGATAPGAGHCQLVQLLGSDRLGSV